MSRHECWANPLLVPLACQCRLLAGMWLFASPYCCAGSADSDVLGQLLLQAAPTAKAALCQHGVLPQVSPCCCARLAPLCCQVSPSCCPMTVPVAAEVSPCSCARSPRTVAPGQSLMLSRSVPTVVPGQPPLLPQIRPHLLLSQISLNCCAR